jgi:vacuolar-type H+-ATPase subunit H
LEAQGERLLQDLVTQEKNLVRKVEEAKAKAKAELDQATADAAKLVEEAKARAEAAAKRDIAAAAKEAEDAREAIVRSAREGAELLRVKARNNSERAVAAVLDKVQP